MGRRWIRNVVSLRTTSAGIEVSLHGFEVVEDDRCLGDHTPIRRTPQE